MSYARAASRDEAEELASALGGRAFLDTTGVDVGRSIPAGLVDALLGAQVIVVFAEPTYFTRWYCLRELNVALAAFNALVRRGAAEPERAAALLPVVVAMPRKGSPEFERLPAAVRVTNWPAADDTDAVTALVEERLAA